MLYLIIILNNLYFKIIEINHMIGIVNNNIIINSFVIIKKLKNNQFLPISRILIK